MEHYERLLAICLKFAVLCLILLEAEDPTVEWSLYSDFSLQDEGVCNIDVLDSSQLSYQQFIKREETLSQHPGDEIRTEILLFIPDMGNSLVPAAYAYRKPVIIRGLTDNTKFRFLCSKSTLLTQFGDRKVELSTANTHSYKKVYVTFQEYVGGLLRPQAPDALGSETLYFFGGNNMTEWNSLFQHYESPPYVLPHTSGAYSFGIAGPGTGVPFHWHGPGFAEVIYGKKRWFFYPPKQEPHFDRNRTTLSWVTEVYPNLPEEEAPLECTIRPGEVLYFPDLWWHATLNLDTSVFISTFLG